MNYGVAYVAWIVICFGVLFCLLGILLLRVCLPSCFEVQARDDPATTPVLPATVLINRVDGDANVDVTTAGSAGVHRYNVVAVQGARESARSTAHAHSRASSLGIASSETHRTVSTASVGHSRRSGWDGSSARESTTSMYDSRYGSSRPGSRDSRRGRVGSSSGRGWSTDEVGDRNSHHDGSSDDGTDAVASGTQASRREMLPHRPRSQGSRHRLSYPMALDLLPLGTLSANPLRPAGVRPATTGERVGSTPASPQRQRGQLPRRVNSRDSRRGTRRWGRGIARLWQQHRRRRSVGDGALYPPHTRDGASTAAAVVALVVDGYCCDEYGNRVSAEHADRVYGRAHYISRPPEHTAAVDAARAIDVDAEEMSRGGVSYSVFGDTESHDEDDEWGK
ncbi:hypothetical protein NESM_000875900 [Novymonas esmeraldas]|uniref:Membrane-associated protein n=1 Tax=Novymonas esmeraldas TaxID=1808958 RepID=A0AAW0F011_9TRYP